DDLEHLQSAAHLDKKEVASRVPAWYNLVARFSPIHQRTGVPVPTTPPPSNSPIHGSNHFSLSPRVIDIGGEGRHPEAWNVNPSSVKTLGPGRGEPIPRHILGRSESLPLEDASVDLIIVEKTPLRRGALEEIARVISPGGRVILRHVPLPGMDCHELAK